MKRKWAIIVLILSVLGLILGFYISCNRTIGVQVQLNTSAYSERNIPTATEPVTAVPDTSVPDTTDPVVPTTENNETTTTVYVPETTTYSEPVTEESATVKEEPVKPAGEKKYTIGCVAARKTPDLCSLPSTIIRGGTAVQKIGSEGLFAKILYNGEIYYVCSARIGDIGIGLVSIFDLF